METGNNIKAATFRSFLHLSYKNLQCFLMFYIKQFLTNDF